MKKSDHGLNTTVPLTEVWGKSDPETSRSLLSAKQQRLTGREQKEDRAAAAEELWEQWQL